MLKIVTCKNAKQCQLLVSFSAQCLYWKRRLPLWSEHDTPDSPHPAQLLVKRSFHRNVSSHTARSVFGEGPSSKTDVIVCYPHMPVGKMWIYRLLFVCFLSFCVFVRLRISPTRIMLAASNFARRFIGVLDRKSPILGNFAPQKPKIGQIGAQRSLQT